MCFQTHPKKTVTSKRSSTCNPPPTEGDAMANQNQNLFSLLHELRDRIAASTSSPPSNGEENDPLETKFRIILHGLLKDHVSSTANEREVVAVLKLLSHTARNFPGVFFHGKASAVLPFIGRILPFFAEPSFISWHGVIFETVGSLLSLLRTGDREAFRQFFFDSMVLVEGNMKVRSYRVVPKGKIQQMPWKPSC